MLSLIKPGHVIRFGVCPSTLTPPKVPPGKADNTRVVKWPDDKKSLGNVVILSHPSGVLGPVCAQIANGLRGGGNLSRKISYSKLGAFVKKEITKGQDVRVASAQCDFVGYTEGQANYISSQNIVFSKDFTGCLMVSYAQNSDRRVAHVAASGIADNDCKQSFLDGLHHRNGQLDGWFRPHEGAEENHLDITFDMVTGYISSDPRKITTFGVMHGMQAYSIEAFKPFGIPGVPATDWVVTRIVPKGVSQSWIV